MFDVDRLKAKPQFNNIGRLGNESEAVQFLTTGPQRALSYYSRDFKYYVVLRQWESAWDWFDDAETGASSMKTWERSSRLPTKGTDRWAGSDWPTAMRLAREGWPEIAREVSELADSLRFEIEDEYQFVHVTEIKHAVAGAFVDVGAYLANEPEAMLDIQVEDRPRPVIKLLVSNTAAFRVTPEAIKRRGVVIVALIDLLEQMNMRCEVVMHQSVEQPVMRAFFTRAYNESTRVGQLHYYVRIKRPDSPVQVDGLMFLLSHPASLRRIGFSVMERESSTVREPLDILPFGNYGSVATMYPVEHDIYVPPLSVANPEFNSDEGAKAWVLDVLADQGLIFVDRQGNEI